MKHIIGSLFCVGALAMALSGCGGGSPTSSVSPSDAAAAPTAATIPSAPLSVVATARNAALDISFLPPSTSGGAPILDYSATCSANGQSSVTIVNTGSPITLASLVNGQSYNCTVTARNSVGPGPASASVSATPSQGAILAATDIVLGAPTDTRITATIYSTSLTGSASIAYGVRSGVYDNQTPAKALTAGTPTTFTWDGLKPNTRYYYKLNVTSDRTGAVQSDSEASFITARPAGSTFTFVVQGDSHPEREKSEFNGDLYTRTLTYAAADSPDFFITSGDDFSVDTLNAATIDAEAVAQRYRLQRPYLGIIGRQAPVFLVNGNHEQAARYLLNGTANNVAVWAQTARNLLYAQPAPDAFYSGNAETVPYIGLLRNYYAWTWGDALFVVIDPYWASPVAVDNVFGGGSKTADSWQITHGDAQYNWLKKTLETSKAKFKFVFAHHVLGTGRGGVEVARFYEWGGQNANGSSGFEARRPNWASPIHNLLAANHVTIFFQGHDHIWARGVLDGVIYQTLPEPANPNYNLLNADAYSASQTLPNSGYARVTVSPTEVKVDYVRIWLPGDEAADKKSGTVATSYKVTPP
jgi:Calcineurin-like phosphoesterase/Fibronectin type III domain